MEFRVIVDQHRNGEASIRDELTVCRWEEARIGGNWKRVKQQYFLSLCGCISSPIYSYKYF